MTARGQGPDRPKRWEIRLEQQALRNDWPIPKRKRQQILKRLLDLLTDEKAADRTVIAAAQTLALFGGLNSKQAALDLQAARQSGKQSDVDWPETVRAAQQRALERKAERERGNV